jgi:hypothetical protein
MSERNGDDKTRFRKNLSASVIIASELGAGDRAAEEVRRGLICHRRPKRYRHGHSHRFTRGALQNEGVPPRSGD